ncbi:MAG: winged helix-turn-helix domain-containing protein [Candidatus Thorarchaeota archaeon]|nr:winged helix-turn-helix domain-containing protein [Candidatus Thorarchaeota archaeon]
MTGSEEIAARMTLKLAGELQQIRDVWVRRLENYFTQLESLVEGQWLDTSDLKGLIRESQSAAREALDGLGGDLSAVLVHESGGLFARFESERQSLSDEINTLRSELAQVLSGNENAIRIENQTLRAALFKIPEFKLLKIIKESGRASYKALSKSYGGKATAVRKLVKSLEKMGYVAIDKKSRPHTVVFLSAPWYSGTNDEPLAQTLDLTSLQESQVEHP